MMAVVMSNFIRHEVIEREAKKQKTVYNKHQIYNRYARLASMFRSVFVSGRCGLRK